MLYKKFTEFTKRFYEVNFHKLQKNLPFQDSINFSQNFKHFVQDCKELQAPGTALWHGIMLNVIDSGVVVW